MIDLFARLIVVVILTTFLLLFFLIVRALQKKPIKKLGLAILICVASIFPLAIIGAVLDPSTWCEHEYEITKEIAPTCLEDGEIHKYCSLCERDDVEYIDAIGHSMKEASRIEPTYDNEGKVIKKCERCDFEDIEYIDKLEPTKTTTEPTNTPEKETSKPTTKLTATTEPTTTVIESESHTTTKPSTTEAETTTETKTAAEKFAESKNISVELAQSIEYVLGKIGYSLSQAYNFEQTDDWANGRRFKVWIDMEYICYFYVQDEEVVSIRRSNGDFVWKQAE